MTERSSSGSDRDRSRDVPQVYFIQTGKFIKIGFTTNLKDRVKSFETGTAERITVLAVFPGLPGGRTYRAGTVKPQRWRFPNVGTCTTIFSGLRVI